jgi:2'-5' RNA ligase
MRGRSSERRNPALGKEIRGRGCDFPSLRFRAFISADISPSDSLAALLDQLRESRADIKVVRPTNLHFTLKFLGDTEEELVDVITDRMRESVGGTQAFKIKLKGIGAFPSMSNIRVIWIGIEDGRHLTGLAARLDSSLEEIGLERDRKGFKPHLTVARARGSRGLDIVQGLIVANAVTDFGGYSIDKIVLKKSTLTPQGPRYSNISEVMLAQG